MFVRLGQLVYSKAGRDKRRPFVVVEILNKEYVKVVDGDLRKVDRPKKKKNKHLLLTLTVFDAIEQKIQRKVKIYDDEIRKTLELKERNL
jgi:large subunit ribosomal protein L14e